MASPSGASRNQELTLTDLKYKLQEIEAEKQAKQKLIAAASSKIVKLKPHHRILPKKISNSVEFYPVVDPLNNGMNRTMDSNILKYPFLQVPVTSCALTATNINYTNSLTELDVTSKNVGAFYNHARRVI